MIKCLAVAFACLLLGIATAATMGWAESWFAYVRRLPGGDKIAHLLLMGTMSLLLNLAMRCQRVCIAGISVLRGTLLLIVLVTFEELAQIWIPTRTFSWLDLGCNYIGIVLFGWVAVRLTSPIAT